MWSSLHIEYVYIYIFAQIHTEQRTRRPHGWGYKWLIFSLCMSEFSSKHVLFLKIKNMISKAKLPLGLVLKELHFLPTNSGRILGMIFLTPGLVFSALIWSFDHGLVLHCSESQSPCRLHRGCLVLSKVSGLGWNWLFQILNLSEPQFPHLWKGDDSYPRELLWWVN